MSFPLLLQLTENDKRIIIAVCFVFILVFVLIGLLGSLIIRVMRWQGKKCDTLVSDVVTHRIITEPRRFRKYAFIKNARLFIKQAWIPLVIIFTGGIILLIHNIVTKNWLYNPFINKEDGGFASLLFLWDFTQMFTRDGVNLIVKWPPLINEPTFVVEGIYAYLCVPCFVVGGCWYFVAAQAYLARTIRSFALAKRVFEKSLENFDQNSPIPPDMNQEQK